MCTLREGVPAVSREGQEHVPLRLQSCMKTFIKETEEVGVKLLRLKSALSLDCHFWLLIQGRD